MVGWVPMNTDKIARLQEFTLLFDTAWATYKLYFIRLIKINWIPVAVISLLFASFSFIGEFLNIADFLKPEDIIQVLVLAFGASVLVVGISSLNYIAQIKTLSSEVPISSASAYQFAAKNLFPYIWVIILASFFIMVGLILLIVPGIVVAVWLAFTSFVLIEGKAKGLDALRVSKRYVRGIWLQVLIRFLSAVLLGMLVGSAFAIFLDFIENIFGVNMYVENILNLMYQLIVAPYFVVYGYELYKDVVKANQEYSAKLDSVSEELVTNA
jgi:hypothetical protein